jgi:hypothetical protein
MVRIRVDYKYIFIIGAAKCGTTALAEILGQSKHVCLSTPKESDYFTDRVFNSRSKDWYDKCFSKKPEAEFRLDASVSYTIGWNGTSSNIAKRIKKFSPDCKLIYIVRDPIDRTWASYWHDARNLKKQNTFLESIGTDSHHVTGSLYSQRIRDYLKHFDRSQILVLDHHRLKEDSEMVISEVCGHIGLELKEGEGFKVVKKNKSYQLNYVGSFILKLVGLNIVKGLVRNLGENSFIKKTFHFIMTKPVKKISSLEADQLKQLYDVECYEVEKEFGIKLKHAPSWYTSQS